VRRGGDPCSALQYQTQSRVRVTFRLRSYDTDSSRKMRHATALLKAKHPEIEADVNAGIRRCRRRLVGRHESVRLVGRVIGVAM